jgi:hypothetical protein
LSTAVLLQKESTVPNEEVQRWYGWLGEQQSLLPLLRTEPQIIQPVAALRTNNFHSVMDQPFHSIMPHNITINELLFTVFVYKSNYVLDTTATAVTYFNMLFLAGVRFLVVYSTSRFPFSFFLLCCLLLLSVFLIL